MQHPLHSIGKLNSGNQRTWRSLSARVKQLNALSCRYSKNSGETTMLMLSRRQRRTVRRHTRGSSLKTKAWWDPIQPQAMTCQSMQKLIPQVMFAFFGNQSEKKRSFLVRRCLKRIFFRNQKDHSRICAGKQLIRFFSALGPVAVVIWGSDLSITEDNVVPLRDVFRTRRKGNWWPDQIFGDYHVVCAISIMSKQWGHLIVFDIFFAKVLKKVQHCRVDVIAGDATAAAYRCYKRQSCQALYNSSVAVMLREMQREVDMNRPFQSRLLCDHSTNNHHSQLPSTDYPYCGFHVFSLMEKTAGTQNCEWTLEQHVWAYREWSKRKMLRTALISRVLKSCWERRLGRAIQIQRTLTILWLHHETIRSFRCWCFRTKIAGSDPCTYRGDFLFLWPFVSCFSEMYRGRSIANLEARDEARSRRLRKTKQSDQSHRDTIWQSHSYWQWDPLHGLSRQGHAWRGK